MSDKREFKDQKFLSAFPSLLKEWHQLKNGNIKPSEVNSKSAALFWWLCPNGSDHEWKASPRNRTVANSGCPFCAGQKACATNNLFLSRPWLREIWDEELNSRHPSSLLHRTNYVANFRCTKNKAHRWEQNLRNSKIECPHCFKQEKSIFGVTPDLKNEWDFEKNSDLGLDPDRTASGSGKKAYWICSNDGEHRWEAQIRHRSKGIGCPYCSGQKATPTSNLSTDFPDIAKEWHPTKNGKAKPEHIRPHSGKKYWWLCNHGHSYLATADARTRLTGGSGCPKCSNSTSSPEIRLFSEICFFYPEAKQRQKINGYELDVWLPRHNIGIEYDGAYWHRKKHKLDLKKNTALEKNGVKLIRVRAKPLKKIRDHDVLTDADDLVKNDILNLLKSINYLVGKNNEIIERYLLLDGFVNNSEYQRIMSYLPSPLPENSLANGAPESIELWDYDKNYPLIPSNFTAHSNKVVSWRCTKAPDHQWSMSINTFENIRKCPFCAKKRPSSTYNLSVVLPNMASEWHPSKNNIQPKDVLPQSGKRVWWQCVKDNSHEWQTSINSRATNSTGCPFCSGRRASKTNNLSKTHSHLIESWDFERNKISPSEVTEGSNKIVHWICTTKSYHQWEAPVVVRRNTGCPFCSGKRTHEFDSVGYNYPEILVSFKRFSSKEHVGFDISTSAINSAKNARWECSVCETEYTCSIKQRIDNFKCPRCFPKKSIKSGTRRKPMSLFEKRPDLSLEWHTAKNKVEPSNVFPPWTSEQCWWLSDCGHEWEATISRRMSGNISCLICKKEAKIQALKTEALKYKSRWEFQKSSKNMYMQAYKNGWLDEVCSHMQLGKKPDGYWTFDRCRSEAMKFEKRGDFKKGSRYAYNLSLKNNWIDNFFTVDG